ncbi:MAG TPA: hypothetical protein VLS48_05240 [Anaerolineales bacterium]|nr:hypothetical protein [Anaerolineales bacterium]
MTTKSSAQISKQSFLQSILILFVLMLAAGLLTRFVPAGQFDRVVVDGRAVIDPASFQITPRPDFPVWRWFTAPVEVLFAPNGLTIIVILVFLLLVGAAFAVLDQSGLIGAALAGIVRRLGGRKYVILAAVTLFFMTIGAFFGVFEEVVPLTPIIVALAYYLGWDALIGLGMSILATNLGFSAAVTNPFTIGVAQQIAGLPLFSGAWFRITLFITVYAVLMVFLILYARRIERQPARSLTYSLDQSLRAHYKQGGAALLEGARVRPAAMVWLAGVLALILAILVGLPFYSPLADFSLPLVGILFFVGGLGAGYLAGASGREVWQAAGMGILGIAPAIPLILMAASVAFIVNQGGIMDTLLFSATRLFAGASPFTAVVMIYFLALALEVFVPSGSAKAFLMMPILLPLADLVGVTRQMTITAYCFGDGFSNLAYPTNPVLLVALGLTVVGYPKWIRWTALLWLGIFVVTFIFLLLGVAIGLGPF